MLKGSFLSLIMATLLAMPAYAQFQMGNGNNGIGISSTSCSFIGQMGQLFGGGNAGRGPGPGARSGLPPVSTGSISLDVLDPSIDPGSGSYYGGGGYGCLGQMVGGMLGCFAYGAGQALGQGLGSMFGGGGGGCNFGGGYGGCGYGGGGYGGGGYGGGGCYGGGGYGGCNYGGY